MGQNNTPISAQELVNVLIDAKFADFFQDERNAKRIITWISSEIGVPRTLVRMTYYWLAPLVVMGLKEIGGAMGRKGVGLAYERLEKLPYFSKLAGALIRFTKEPSVIDSISGSSVETIEVTRDYRAIISEIQDLQSHQEDIGDVLSEIRGLLRPQPPLVLDTVPFSEENRFYYGAERVPFTGRDTELDQIASFLYASDPFMWWMIVGAGGIGKSRLALELCYRHGGVWRAGFLPVEQTFGEWNNWAPERPTLLIVDYASIRAGELRKIVTQLYRRKDQFDWPIRILLIERNIEGEWWRDFSGAKDHASHLIKASQFRDPMEIQGFSSDDVWKTVTSILPTKLTKGRKKQILKDLSNISPEFNPLYTAFAADALSKEVSIRHWDRKALLEYVIERELSRWRHAGLTNEDLNLLALATITSGFKVSLLSSPRLKCGVLPSADSFQPVKWSGVFGIPCTDSVPAYEPDILGAYFAIKHLSERNNGDAPLTVIMMLAWDITHKGTFYFLERLGSDFADLSEIKHFYTHIPTDRIAYLAWALVASYCVKRLALREMWEASNNILDTLDQFARGNPNENGLQDARFRAYCGRSIGLGINSRPKEAISCLKNSFSYSRKQMQNLFLQSGNFQMDKSDLDDDEFIIMGCRKVSEIPVGLMSFLYVHNYGTDELRVQMKIFIEACFCIGEKANGILYNLARHSITFWPIVSRERPNIKEEAKKVNFKEFARVILLNTAWAYIVNSSMTEKWYRGRGPEWILEKIRETIGFLGWAEEVELTWGSAEVTGSEALRGVVDIYEKTRLPQCVESEQ